MESKKSQITAFLIISLLLILSSFFFYISFKQQDKKFEEQERIDPEFVPQIIEQIISSCVIERAEPLIYNVSLHGGEFSYRYEPRLYYHKEYNYHCIWETGRGCINRLITRWQIEEELDILLKEELEECISLQNLKDQGYKIKDADISVKSSIASEDVKIEIEYPIEISKETYNTKIKTQKIDIDLPLGKLLDLAVKITNSEIKQSFFDTAVWMYEHGGEVEIEKHKPYPDTVYSIRKYVKESKKTLEFNFAIMGEDTVSRIAEKSKERDVFGYCVTTDNNCYFNIDVTECLEHAENEHYDLLPPEVKCGGRSVFSNKLCNGEECLDCGIAKNGESWCVYDGVTGNGLDLVGSRHYKKICIDGVIYTEECRDYREELCTENNPDSLIGSEPSSAVCRPNRWQDCAAQTTKEDCEDDDKRDCQWSSWLIANPVTAGLVRQNHTCHPVVPPGFMHWQSQSSDVCGMANEQRDCDGTSCPQRWIDTSASYCLFQGDCGKYYNIAGEFGSPNLNTGYFSTDGDPRNGIYPEKDVAITTSPKPLGLRTDIRGVRYDAGREYEDKVTLDEIIRGTDEYLIWVSRISVSSLVKEYIKHGEVKFHTRHSVICSPWEAKFNGDNCWLCNDSSDKPCTLYRCKSLGQGCQYAEKDGVGYCYSYEDELDSEGPQIVFDSGSLTDNFTATQNGFYFDNFCWQIEPAVPQHSILDFGFNTSEEALCKIAFLPNINYSFIPDPWAPLSFNTSHKRSIRVSSLEQLREEFDDFTEGILLMQMIDLEMYEVIFARMRSNAQKAANKFHMDISDTLSRYDSMLSYYKSTFKPSLTYFYEESQEYINKLLMLMEARNSVLFVKCIDVAGNPNEETFCIQYGIAPDMEPPEIIEIIPDNMSIQNNPFNMTIKLNEPAECKYDFVPRASMDDMMYWMDCATSEISGLAGGYRCETELEMKNNPVRVYVRCIDNPIKSEGYIINLLPGENLRIVAEDIPGAIDLRAPNEINVTGDFAIKGNETIIQIDDTQIESSIHVYFDEAMLCRISDKEGEKYEQMVKDMECDIENDYCSYGFVDIRKYTTYYLACVEKDRYKEIRNENKENTLIIYFKG